jgi:hypothetical protein
MMKKDSIVLALIIIVYAVLSVSLYGVTSVKLGRPFLLPLLAAFLGS